jgi:undecaprenyl phosphate-alpha-L-ara4N flippase subunit ArnE
VPLWVHALLLLSSLSAAGGQLMLKEGAAGRTTAMEFVNPWLAGGLTLYVLGALLWIVGLSKAPLTLVYPYTALTFVIVYASGAALFGEVVPPRALAGIGLVLVGLLLINLR